jgi:hypothetical protein
MYGAVDGEVLAAFLERAAERARAGRFRRQGGQSVASFGGAAPPVWDPWFGGKVREEGARAGRPDRARPRKGGRTILCRRSG